MYYIYKITNIINNKIYVGKTEKTPQERLKDHFKFAESNLLDTAFARAIRKYSREAFSVEIIDTTEDKQELSKKEIYWISKLNSLDRNVGYNSTPGGEGGNTYINKTEDEMLIIKEKLRQTKIGNKNPNSNRVKCFDTFTEEEFHFSTVKECKEYFGETQHNFITRRVNGETHYLYRGRYKIAYENKDFDFQEWTNKKCAYHNK